MNFLLWHKEVLSSPLKWKLLGECRISSFALTGTHHVPPLPPSELILSSGRIKGTSDIHRRVCHILSACEVSVENQNVLEILWFGRFLNFWVFWAKYGTLSFRVNNNLRKRMKDVWPLKIRCSSELCPGQEWLDSRQHRRLGGQF